MTKTTQGRELIQKLKKRPMTYREMLNASASISPWKRVQECLAENEFIAKGTSRQGWTTWRVVSI